MRSGISHDWAARTMGTQTDGKRGGSLPITPENPFGLTEQCRLFVLSYIRNFDALGAAMSAGYSESTARRYASEMLLRPQIQAAINAAVEARRIKVQECFAAAELTAERVLLEIARISFVDPRRLYDADGIILPIHDWPDDVAHAVAKIETEEILEYDPQSEEKVFIGYRRKISYHDKNQSLEKLMKHLGQYEQDNLQRAMQLRGETPKLVVVRDLLQRILDKSKTQLDKATPPS